MKKRLIIGILVAAIIAGGGYYYSEYGIPGTSSSDEFVYVTRVSTLLGNDRAVVNRYAGVVESQTTSKITADSNRVVKEIYVTEGEEVKAGQLLFEYDQSSIEDELLQAQLDLERLQNEALSYQEQITTLEKEKASASSDKQLSYTIEIETNKMNLKKNEYDQKTKQAEIEKLQSASGNTEVRSEIDGVVQKIDTSKITMDASGLVSDSLVYDSSSSGSDSSNTFITILSTGSYRVKGQVNELNYSNLILGSSMIIRSRKDETMTWSGTLSSIDTENTETSSDSYSYYGMSSSGGYTSSSSYPFYVTLDSSDGLMLGQHVYIELDAGQEDSEDGLWLNEYFIVDTDQPDPYVWAADENGKLQKVYVVLGQHEEYLMQYEIVSGITEEDSIAFPIDSLKEGMRTRAGSTEETLASMYSYDFYEEELYDYEEEVIESDPGMYDESELESFIEDGMYVESDQELILDDDMEDIPMDEVFEEPVLIEELEDEDTYSGGAE